MKSFIFTSLIMFVALTIKADDFDLTVEGLRITKDGVKGTGEYGQGDLRPFNQSKGTSLAVFLRSAKSSIISLDQSNSKVISFVDDKNTDLLKSTDPKEMNWGNNWGFVQTSEDKKTLSFELSGKNIPAADTKVLTCVVELSFYTGGSTKIVDVPSMLFKKGNKFMVENKEFLIENTGKPQWGEDKFELTIKASMNLDGIISVGIKNSKGEVIKGKEGGSYSTSFGDKIESSQSYTFSESFEEGALQFEMYSDLEKKTIKKEVKVELGLK